MVCSSYHGKMSHDVLLKAHIEQLTAAWKIDLIKFSEVVWG